MRILSNLERFGPLVKVLECLEEFRSVRERFGAYGRVLERLGTFGAFGCFGAFGRVSERL